MTSKVNRRKSSTTQNTKARASVMSLSLFTLPKASLNDFYECFRLAVSLLKMSCESRCGTPRTGIKTNLVTHYAVTFCFVIVNYTSKLQDSTFTADTSRYYFSISFICWDNIVMAL